MSVLFHLAFATRAGYSSEAPSEDNFFGKLSMTGVASFFFLLVSEFLCSDLIKVLDPSGAAEVFSQTFVIVLQTMTGLAMLELQRSELLDLTEICLIHPLSVRIGKSVPIEVCPMDLQRIPSFAERI